MRRLRDDKINRGGRRYGSSPFHVQIGFAFVTAHEAGIGAVQDYVQLPWTISRQAKNRSKISYVLQINVALPYDGDVLSCAGRCGWNVVNRREVRRAHRVKRAVHIGEREGRPHLASFCVALECAQRVHLRFWSKIVQRHYAAYDRYERCRNLRIANISEVVLALYVEVANLRAEGTAHLAYVAGKFHHCLAFAHLDVLESMRVQPVGHGLHIGVRGPKSFAKVFRGQPRMEIRKTLANDL